MENSSIIKNSAFLHLTTAQLKIIALTAMLISHIATIFFPILPHYVVIFGAMFGGITFPIMVYLLVQGAVHTKNIDKYLLRLFILWVVSIAPFYLATNRVFAPTNHVVHGHFSALDLFNNVGCTLFFSLLMIKLLRKYSTKSRLLKFGIVAGCFLLSLPADWGGIGVILALLLYYFRKSPLQPYLVPCIISFSIILLGCYKYFIAGFWMVEPITYLTDAIIRGCGPLLAIPLLKCYAPDCGKPSAWQKYSFYIFYPLHLFILWIFVLILL